MGRATNSLLVKQRTLEQMYQQCCYTSLLFNWSAFLSQRSSTKFFLTLDWKSKQQ